MVVVGVVWLLSSAAIALVLRIAELTSIVGLMVDLSRRPRPGVTADRRPIAPTADDGTPSSPTATPARISSSSGWARVKAVNGWTANRTLSAGQERGGELGRSAPRSWSAGRDRCHGRSPTRRADP